MLFHYNKAWHKTQDFRLGFYDFSGNSPIAPQKNFKPKIISYSLFAKRYVRKMTNHVDQKQNLRIDHVAPILFFVLFLTYPSDEDQWKA